MQVVPHNLMLDSLGVAVVAVDAKRRIVYLNQAAERLTGFSQEKALGASCRLIVGGAGCSQGCLLERMMAGETSVEVGGSLLNPERGGEQKVWIKATPLKNTGGRTVGVVKVLLPQGSRRAYPLAGRQFASGEVITCDRHMLSIMEVVPVIAASDCTVLVSGDTGTGKDLLAKEIHRLSPRSGGPFVKVNCAALPENLLESELFGYARGAFTGAERDKPGRFAQAAGGTVFLDEIGEVPLGLQAKLLRVLEDGTFHPLGGRREELAEVRVVTATNRDLKEMVEAGDFREDLYYRLNVVHFDLPALRERRADLPLLIQYFVDRLGQREGSYVRSVNGEALQLLLAYHYPGNVRELINVLEHAVILCAGSELLPEHLPRNLQNLERTAAAEEARRVTRSKRHAGDERAHLLRTLEQHGWRRAEAAAALGMNRTTLWRKMKRYHLDREAPGRAG